MTQHTPSLLLAALLLSGAVACSDDSGGASEGATTASNTASSNTSADTGAGDDTGAAGDTGAADTGAVDGAVADTGSPMGEGWGVAAAMPTPRQETSVVALGGEVWVLGGFDDTGTVVPTVAAYDPATDTWRSAAELPVAMHHSNAAAVGGRIVVVGFLVGLGFLPDGRCFVYDPGADAWSGCAPMPDGTERGGSGVAVVGGRVFVVGGLRGQATTLMSAYDPEADAWEALPDVPTPRDHMAAVGIDGRVIVVGGRNRSIGSHTTRVDIYDPAGRGWSRGAEMPTSRGGVAAAALDGVFYVFGGEGNGDDPTGVFAAAEAYDVAADRWTVLEPMPVPRHGNGAAAVDGVIYIPGGADVQAFGAIDTHERYAP